MKSILTLRVCFYLKIEVLGLSLKGARDSGKNMVLYQKNSVKAGQRHLWLT